MTRIFAKTLRWLFFSVLLALVPLAYAYISLLIRDRSPTLDSILADGGLFLIVSAFSAGALGELIGSTARFRVYKIVCAGLTMMSLLLSTMMFASISEARLTSHMNESVIKLASLIIFANALLSSAACIAFSET